MPIQCFHIANKVVLSALTGVNSADVCSQAEIFWTRNTERVSSFSNLLGICIKSHLENSFFWQMAFVIATKHVN